MKISYFLIMFFLINFSAVSVMSEFSKGIHEEKLYLDKEHSRVLAESGGEIALSKIFSEEPTGTFAYKEDIGEIKISIEEEESTFLIKSAGFFGRGKTEVEIKVKITEENNLETNEKKMW